MSNTIVNSLYLPHAGDNPRLDKTLQGSLRRKARLPEPMQHDSTPFFLRPPSI